MANQARVEQRLAQREQVDEPERVHEEQRRQQLSDENGITLPKVHGATSNDDKAQSPAIGTRSHNAAVRSSNATMDVNTQQRKKGTSQIMSHGQRSLRSDSLNSASIKDSGSKDGTVHSATVMLKSRQRIGFNGSSKGFLPQLGHAGEDDYSDLPSQETLKIALSGTAHKSQNYQRKLIAEKNRSDQI